MNDSRCTPDDTEPAVDLETFRVKSNLSYQQLAKLIGVPQAKQARSYALGHRWPRDGAVLDAIVARTNGGVSIEAMHRRRSIYQRRESVAEPIVSSPQTRT